MSAMRTSQLAARCGVPATTLRYYESAGLLLAVRESGACREVKAELRLGTAAV
ncbi:MerR family DNA-binding transcriptional regulator [Streptomyces sp. NPDC055036]